MSAHDEQPATRAQQAQRQAVIDLRARQLDIGAANTFFTYEFRDACKAGAAALRAPQETGLTALSDKDIADLDLIREYIGPDQSLRDTLVWLKELPPAPRPQEAE